MRSHKELARRLLAVPGGPSSSTCSPAMRARIMLLTTSSRSSTSAPSSHSTRASFSQVSVVVMASCIGPPLRLGHSSYEMHARARPAKSVRSRGLRLANPPRLLQDKRLSARPPRAFVPSPAHLRGRGWAILDANLRPAGRRPPPSLRDGAPATSRCGGEVGASPDRGRTAMMACVVREGRDRDTKGARQAEGPKWAGRSGPSDGPGPGGGIAGYSRGLLRGAPIYAGRGIPVFPCEAGGKRPLTADGFLEATTDGARIRRWW